MPPGQPMSVALPQASARGWLLRAIWVLAAGCAFLLILPYLLTPLYRMVDPVSTLMIWRWAKRAPVERVTVPIDLLPPALPRTVIAAEDARFCSHHGIDFDELRRVVKAETNGVRRPRGGSSITQQLAKNLFLWPGRSYVRKALEFPLALWIDFVVPKRRQLEIYLNIAEWGPSRSRRSPGVRQTGRRPVGLRSGLAGRRTAQSDPARYPTTESCPAPARRHLRGARGLRNRCRPLCASGALVTCFSRSEKDRRIVQSDRRKCRGNPCGRPVACSCDAQAGRPQGSPVQVDRTLSRRRHVGLPSRAPIPYRAPRSRQEEAA